MSHRNAWILAASVFAGCVGLSCLIAGIVIATRGPASLDGTPVAAPVDETKWVIQIPPPFIPRSSRDPSFVTDAMMERIAGTETLYAKGRPRESGNLVIYRDWETGVEKTAVVPRGEKAIIEPDAPAR